MKICIVTCYNQPDYIRTKTLRAGLQLIDNIEVVELKNRHTGLLRYPEVLLKVLLARIKHGPDAYLLTFRGYEMLLPVRILTAGKPLIYDEFINPIEWVVHEKRQVEAKQGSGKLYSWLVAAVSRAIVFIVSSRLFRAIYRLLLRSVDLVLADTSSHADISAKLTGVNRNKFFDIPVGTDETMFGISNKESSENDTFTVFYYGNMLPLHGLQCVIDAAVKMKHESVRFVLIGGNARVAQDVAVAIAKGANIDYKAWVEFDKLPSLMNQAHLCLAGPFGDTFQAQYVITGKEYQYLAMGRPTVIGQNKESGIFTDKKDALIVPQGDSNAMVDAVRWAAMNKQELRRIGLNGRRLYDKEFSATKIAKKLDEALLRLGLTKLGAHAKSKQ